MTHGYNHRILHYRDCRLEDMGKVWKSDMRVNTM